MFLYVYIYWEYVATVYTMGKFVFMVGENGLEEDTYSCWSNPKPIQDKTEWKGGLGTLEGEEFNLSLSVCINGINSRSCLFLIPSRLSGKKNTMYYEHMYKETL